MKFKNLYKGVFAILRIENNQAKVVGTGFVINTKPLYILTCNHVVSEGSEQNNGNIRYAITKRSDSFDEFDIRQGQISWLSAKNISYKPENDVAILEIDPLSNPDVSEKLALNKVDALKLSFNRSHRSLGSEVEWLSTAASGDLTLTPRFFKGNLITRYTTDHQYKYKNSQGAEVGLVMNGVNLIEVDKLFIPGLSGSPILSVASNKVIGYVHGFRSWPIMTSTEFKHRVEMIDGANSKNIDLKYKLPLVGSLSLAIDIRTMENYLKEGGFIRGGKKLWF